jgi:HCOMODA/2-hydroxy-3-carboxy-muconic semialdehyde decarboxylase
MIPQSEPAMRSRNRSGQGTGRNFEGRFPDILLLAAAVISFGTVAHAQQGQGSVTTQLIDDLVTANRILAMEGVLDGYGHVSARSDKDPDRYYLSRSLAPDLVEGGDVMVFDLDSKPVDPHGRTAYVEAFIHGEIYRARPDVKAVIHTHSPALIPFGVTSVPLRPIYTLGAFIGEGVPVFDIRTVATEPTDLLIRNAALGRALSQALGNRGAALMRGHGAVVVGPSLQDAVGRSVYLQINAALQLQAITLGGPIQYLGADEARKLETIPNRYQRAWEMWKRKAMGK